MENDKARKPNPAEQVSGDRQVTWAGKSERMQIAHEQVAGHAASRRDASRYAGEDIRAGEGKRAAFAVGPRTAPGRLQAPRCSRSSVRGSVRSWLYVQSAPAWRSICAAGAVRPYAAPAVRTPSRCARFGVRSCETVRCVASARMGGFSGVSLAGPRPGNARAARKRAPQAKFGGMSTVGYCFSGPGVILNRRSGDREA